MVRGTAIFPKCGVHLSSCSIPGGALPAIPGPVKGGAGPAQPWDFHMSGSSVLTLAMDVITDPSCSRTTDPDLALGSSWGLEVTMAQVTA